MIMLYCLEKDVCCWECWNLLSDENITIPLSVCVSLTCCRTALGHWQRECERWSNLNTVVFHGSREAKKNILRYEWNFENWKNTSTVLFLIILFFVYTFIYRCYLKGSHVLPTFWNVVFICDCPCMPGNHP